MQLRTLSHIAMTAVVLTVGTTPLYAKPKAAPAPATLTAEGVQLEAEYAAVLTTLVKEISASLPKVDPAKLAAIAKANEAVLQATEAAAAAQKDLGQIGSGKALVAHAKGKWIGGADKGIAAAKAALAKASNATEREAAQKELANWEKNRKDGMDALAERQAALDAALRNEKQFTKANEEAQAALTKAKAQETSASKDLLDAVAPLIATDKFDAKLAKATVMTAATPRGLADFAQQGKEHTALVSKLLSDTALMKEMLLSGGARYGKYGRAMEIYAAIQKASPKAAEGHFQRLALATSLVHATPIKQNNISTQTDAPENVDPVKRYLHFEKACLDGELDPAFKSLTTWEYRHVVNADSPDEILQWGRTMLRNYRPDHIYMNDYGWRYVSAVRTEVPYGSQNVHLDIPSQHQHQNIIKNGGICGRRAFFGRFMLVSFGIPTWGVTQKAHAALSHWTPKGWVVNLGAGYHASWWDKDEVSLSGTQFVLETQARAHTADYSKVARAEWVSRILGEPAYNERRKVTGGFWSNVALYQSRILASTTATLGPLGQELGEANEREQKVVSAAVSADDTKITAANGVFTIPAVAHAKTSGKGAAMKSFGGGMQVHALSGYKAEYVIDVPEAGKYSFSARVVTVQDGQKFLIGSNAAPAVESDVPYTVGMWQQSPAVTLDLQQGKNTIHVGLKEGSKGVTIKDFTLKPAK